MRQRLPHLLDYLKEVAPDAICLQEIKCLDEQFPREEIEALGYNVATHGQKSFNGVAILSKHPFEVERGLPGDESDVQSRYLEARHPLWQARAAAGVASICRTAIPSEPRNTTTSSPSWTGLSAMRENCWLTKSR